MSDDEDAKMKAKIAMAGEATQTKQKKKALTSPAGRYGEQDEDIEDIKPLMSASARPGAYNASSSTTLISGHLPEAEGEGEGEVEDIETNGGDETEGMQVENTGDDDARTTGDVESGNGNAVPDVATRGEGTTVPVVADDGSDATMEPIEAYLPEDAPHRRHHNATEIKEAIVLRNETHLEKREQRMRIAMYVFFIIGLALIITLPIVIRKDEEEEKDSTTTPIGDPLLLFWSQSLEMSRIFYRIPPNGRPTSGW
mmetsp:Transcript_118986/g.344149  ORF Transcript_118986/g.344149 Transcript_118986/m.344149 type:complete len:255 (+) Transcript_118986:388-1152(+)